MSSFSDGTDAHFAALFAAAGETVTLSFNGRSSSFTAVAGSTRQERQSAGGVTVDTRIITFRCSASAYKLDTEVVDPKEGHRITRADGRVYSVVPLASGLPVYERNPHSAVLKIYAVEVPR